MDTKPNDQCRICLEPADEMIGLFEDSKTLYKLELCCGVEIPNIPSLPSKICKKCSDILNVAYGFRVLCQRSQEYLSDQQITLELIEVKPEQKINNSVTKLEFQTEITQQDEEKYDEEIENYIEIEEEHHGDYEANIKDGCEEDDMNRDIIEEDENDDKPLIKILPVRAQKKPKSPITLMCNICGNLFKNKATFNYHMKLHRNDKKYECEICPKRFMQTCELRAHMRIHTGEKPYACSYCDRKFRDRSGVTRHERTHTNERPYGCTICGAHFSYSATLKKHERVHTGEKPFTCLICDKRFSEAHQMKAHLGTIRHAEMAKEKNKIESLE